MKTITTTVYEFDELSDRAKERAREWYRESTQADSYFLEEIYGSLKAVFKAIDVKLAHWSLGPYNRENNVTFDLGDAGELKGARAAAWLENHLFSSFRITDDEFKKNRKEYLGYGADYRPGKIKPCPLTGVCYDEDYLDALRGSIKCGDTLKEAFQNLADVCGRLCEAECKHQNEDGTVEENIRANEYTFTVDGKREG